MQIFFRCVLFGNGELQVHVLVGVQLLVSEVQLLVLRIQFLCVVQYSPDTLLHANVNASLFLRDAAHPPQDVINYKRWRE